MTLNTKKLSLLSITTSTIFLLAFTAIPPSYAQSVSPVDLKAYYTFDETSGDLINEATNAGSVNSLGTSADGQLEAGVVQGQTGLLGNSYFFPGSTNGQVELGTSKSQFRFLHDSPTMRWSTNIWINTIDTTTSSGIFSTSGGSTSDVGTDIFYDGRILSERIGVTLPQGILFQPNVIATSTPLNTLAADGQWHMITVTHDHNLASNNMKIYVDGVLVKTETKTAIPPVAANHNEVATIGNFAGPGALAFFAFNGNLDEFSIWDRVLSPSEISNLYNNGAGLSLIAPPNQVPDCSAAIPSTDSLFPPNHKMNDITISGVTDPDGDAVTLMIDGITQDEPTNGTGDGDTSPDGDGVGTDTAQIRAERSGTGDGRVYEISFTADDGNGGMCTGMVSVGVPHDKKSTAVDSGQNFDSTQ